MKYELCIACDHCDPSNTNDRQQVFCEKNPPYVDPFNGCDEFENKALDECFKNIGKSELTDNEIMKALECCSSYGKSCKECPAFVKVDRSKCREVLTGAKDLINRQQAEIERLQAEKENLRCVIEDLSNNTEHTKAEAIKEFAERFKEISCYTAIYEDCREKESTRIYKINAYDLDYLVKEMAGDLQ